MTVIYNTPKDTAAFEKYYTETHLPLVLANQDEIGFTKAELTKFTGNARRQEADLLPAGGALLRLDGRRKKGMATPGFKKVADDLANFATGGLLGMVATETSDDIGPARSPAASSR